MWWIRQECRVLHRRHRCLRDPSVQYETRHGQGYSTFISRHGNVGLELTHTVDPDQPVRLSSLKITNHGGTAKQLRVYGFVEWVLGNARAKTSPFIVPSCDTETGVLFARNPYGTDRRKRVAFYAASVKPQSVYGRSRRVLRSARFCRSSSCGASGKDPVKPRRSRRRSLRCTCS